MAGEDGRSCRSCQTVAVMLVLCSLAPSLTCFSLRGLSNQFQQDEVVREAAVMDVRTGSILFNGKELSSVSGSASDAATEMSQFKDAMATEAAWRRLNPTLHCGQTKMKLKMMGPGAADLQLDMGNTLPLPLIQVPETCGYLVQQNARRLVLVVPYDGCNVTQENGNYVVPLSWLEIPVKLTCPVSPSSDSAPASTTPKPARHPWKLPFPHRPGSMYRHKRHTPISSYDPRIPYLYYYYMYMMRPSPSTVSPTVTPEMTTNAKPTTEKPQIKPPAYPYYVYYPYYPYYYLNYPVRTTVPPATTTGPANVTSSTTKAPQNPFAPYYFPYFFYPPQVLPGTPDSDVYYYPIIQHFYGKPADTQTTSQPTQSTTQVPTTKPGDSNPTTKSTTAPTATTTRCPHTQPTAQPTTQPTTQPNPGGYQTPVGQFAPYQDFPFAPYISYVYSKTGKLPDDLKYIPQAGYKSGSKAQAYPLPGFDNWLPAPWFSSSTGQDIPQFDWEK